MSISVRPTSYAGWASGPSGYVVEPLAADKAQGFLPTGIARSSYYNWLQNANYQWQKYLDETRAIGNFGDGSDGDFTFNGVATGPAWATGPSGFTYRMVRDANGGNIALTSGVELQTANFRLFANRLAATGSGRITSNGPPGNGATGPRGGLPNIIGPGSVGGGGAGGTGGPSSTASGAAASGLGVTGFGGVGGDSLNSAGGHVYTPDQSLGTPRALGGPMFGQLVGAGQIALIQGGGGGAGGLGTIAGPGGAGGGGGGVLAVAARSMAVGPTGFQAIGGAGGTGAALGCGGGGGVAILAFLNNELGASYTAPIIAAGGTGGAFGSQGQVFVINPS